MASGWNVKAAELHAQQFDEIGDPEIVARGAQYEMADRMRTSVPEVTDLSGEPASLQATILHRMGIDHERLTFKAQGRNFRLTNVHGHVVREVIA